jgi:hypothetical protein
MTGWNWSFYSTSLAADSWLNSARSLTRASNADERARALEEQFDHLIVITQAIWEIGRDRWGISETELIAKAKEISERGGEHSARLAIRNCPKCGRPATASADKCLYCGTEMPHETVFEKI